MARTLRDAALGTPTARRELEPRGKPYFRSIEEGLHLGYRKPRGQRGRPAVAGKWVARFYVGGQTYELQTIATADDVSDANGLTVLSFGQAQAKARSLRDARARTAAGHTGPLKVRDVMADYLVWADANIKSADDARCRVEAYINPELGDLDAASLTKDRIEKWLNAMAAAPYRARARAGKKQTARAVPDTDEARRRRKSSANRTLTTLKAGLNRAWRDSKLPNDAAWRRVTPFENVDAARVRYLSIAEATRLVNASDPGFSVLTEGALQSGARYGELCRNDVVDFNSDAGTLAVRTSKGGKPRYIELTDEGINFFTRLCAGRDGHEPMFRKADGTRWRPSHQKRPVKEASDRAKISPPANFNVLRHTWASHAVMNGVPLMVVAKNLGHSTTRMVEKHYGHLAPSYIKDVIRASAPRFKTKMASNLRSLDRAMADKTLATKAATEARSVVSIGSRREKIARSAAR